LRLALYLEEDNRRSSCDPREGTAGGARTARRLPPAAGGLFGVEQGAVDWGFREERSGGWVRGEWGIMRLAGAVLWFSVIYVVIYLTDMWGPRYPRIPVPTGKIAILKQKYRL
jgi:hypothetical protein